MKYNEKLRKKFKKLAQEVIMPFLEATKTAMEKRGIKCEQPGYISEPASDYIVMEFITEERSKDGRVERTDAPFSIDCDCKFAFFKKPISMSRAPCQPVRCFNVSDITTDFLSKWVSVFIQGMKITETKIIKE